MSDIYIPGIRSRFNSEKLIEDLMKVERIPKDKTEKNIEDLQLRKTWWQDLGRRITSLRESSRMLYSFQNPFNERSAISSDENTLSATATREATEQEYRFTVKQLAQADRFLSKPVDAQTAIDAGTYAFTVGKEEVSVNFRGGNLQEFVDALNRRGRDKISASLMTIQQGSKSLLLESKITGAENRLSFSGNAANLAVKLGLVSSASDAYQEIALSGDSVKENSPSSDGQASGGPVAPAFTVNNGVLGLSPMASVSVPLNLSIGQASPLVLKLETSTVVIPDAPLPDPTPPPGPSIPSAGSVSYGGATVTSDSSAAPLPQWTPPAPPQKLDNLGVLSVTFSDGSTAALPPITDTTDFTSRQYSLADIAAGKTITALNINNANTNRDISVQGIVVSDPDTLDGGYTPLNPVSIAQDAVISMEGIEMTRPSNSINDIISGVTVTAKAVSERPVRLEIRPDREQIKDAIFSMVGNYNRLMAELNVLTRTDDRLVDELTYLDKDEAASMRERLGAFSSDSSLNQFKSNLMRTVSASYPTDDQRDLAMLAQIGISTNTRGGATGYNASQLRGYLEIDEKALDAAMEQHLPAIKQLFGSDTTGDMIIDSGVAYNLESLSRPYVELGGIISLKTGGIDSRITQDQRRIDTMDRQLAAKEAELRVQYSRMESAYARMEQMSTSLQNFSQQNSNNR